MRSKVRQRSHTFCPHISQNPQDPHVPLAAYLKRLQDRGVNFISGEYVDRVSADGSLPPISSQPGLEEQYPLECEVVGQLVQSRTVKVREQNALRKPKAASCR